LTPLILRRKVAKRVLEFWEVQKSKLQSRHAEFTAEAAQFYLQQRARQQLRWFGRSKKRLQDEDLRRTRLLIVLYFSTLVVAVAKLVSHVGNGPHERITEIGAFLLLLTTGLAGAMTGIFFSQNQRSLVHRYHAQERRICDWLHKVKKGFPNLMEEDAGVLAKSPATLRNHFLDFEALMIEELVDWLHITERDKIELRP